MPILLWILLTISPVEPCTAPVHGIDDESDPVVDWIEMLGSDDWVLREDAARKILEAGPAAIGPLRDSLNNPDPEVRARLKEMLTLLSPPLLIVDLLRVGEGSPSSRVSDSPEISGTSVRFTRNNLVQTSVTSIAEERRVQIEIRGSEPPYSVEVLFPGVNSTIVTGPPARGVQPGIPWVIHSEDLLSMEQALGNTRTSGEFATWIALLHHFPDPQLVDEQELLQRSPEERILAAIDDQLATSDDPELWQIAASLPSSITVPQVTGIASERLQDARLMARLGRGDESARTLLSQQIAAHLDGSGTLTADRIDSLIPVALESGIAGALELFERHCGDLSPWRQHLTWRVLQEKIQHEEFAAKHGVTIIRALLAPETLPILRWTNSRLASLWNSLQRKVPGEIWLEVLDERIEDAIGQDVAQSTGRVPLVLGTLSHMANRSHSLPERWQLVVARLISTQHAEVALGVLTAQHIRGGVSETVWKLVCQELKNGLSTGDTTISFRVRNATNRLFESRFLPAESRRLFLQVLVDTIRNGDSSQRSTVDRLLNLLLGSSAVRQVKKVDDTYWTKRADSWQKDLDSLGDEELHPAKEESSWKRISLADFRIDPEGETSLLRMQSAVIPVGERFHATSDSGEDESIHITETRGNTYRLSGSIMLVEERPTMSRLRPRWRRWRYRYSSSRLGAESAQARSMVSFHTVVLMEPIEPEQEPEEPHWESSPRWDRIEQKILDELNSSDRVTRDSTMDIVTTLQLESARDLLIEAWAERESVSIARALLSLGDSRGRDLLMEGIRGMSSRVTRETQKSLEQLLLLGDPEALNLVLEWLETEPGERDRNLENQLPTALRSIESWFSNQRDPEYFPRERLTGALVARCDSRTLRNYAIPMLRRLTGQDMGWWNTFSITDNAERIVAQEEISDLWKQWWTERKERSEDPVKSNPPRDR